MSAPAHAGLLSSDPTAGARLGASPQAVRLTFSEQPEDSLSEIRVLGPGGEPEQLGRARSPGGDPSTLEVPVRRLGKGVYTVNWKVFSAIDGHTSDGTFAFGVQAAPTGVAAGAGATASRSSRFELLARWVFLLGVVVLIGGAVAGVARFGGSSGSDLVLAAAGWATAAVGLVLLAAAQRIVAGSSFEELLDTSIGAALVWRAAALGVAGLALLAAWRRPGARRGALAVATVAALAVVLAHVDAGHAAAGSWSATVAIAAQVAHFAAAGVWFGGLAALLLGFRGASAAAKEAALGRFASVAIAALVDRLRDRGPARRGRARQLGRPARQRLRAGGAGQGRPAHPDHRDRGAQSAPEGGGRRRRPRGPATPLEARAGARRGGGRRRGAAGNACAPPARARPGPPGLSVAGEDFGTTTRVELATASDQPGPNLFTARVEDYDSGEAVAADAVSLRFAPLDDPGSPPSSLQLEQGPDDTYTGSGPNLAFDGRWAVDVLIERNGDAVEVPLELDLPVPEQFVSVLDIPGSPAPPEYTMQTENGYIRISPDPERPGPSQIHVHTYTAFENSVSTDRLVVTAATPGEPVRQLPVRRLGEFAFRRRHRARGRGPWKIGVVARTRSGSRLRGVFKVQIPS